MSYGMGRDGLRWGFSSVADWFNSVIASFPAPWIIGDDTHYGTEIYDNRGVKVLSVWMAFGDPSERQRSGMSDEQWSEYCCDSHWESETQWHIANAIVKSRNYLKKHADNNWYGGTDRAEEILRNLIMSYGRWEEPINKEISCGGPLKRLTEDDPEIIELGHGLSDYGKENRRKDQQDILKKMKLLDGAGT